MHNKLVENNNKRIDKYNSDSIYDPQDRLILVTFVSDLLMCQFENLNEVSLHSENFIYLLLTYGMLKLRINL